MTETIIQIKANKRDNPFISTYQIYIDNEDFFNLVKSVHLYLCTPHITFYDDNIYSLIAVAPLPGHSNYIVGLDKEQTVQHLVSFIDDYRPNIHTTPTVNTFREQAVNMIISYTVKLMGELWD